MEQLQFNCSTHQLPLGAILFQRESYQQLSDNSVLKCLNCIIEQKINGKDLISFQELQNPASQPNNIFSNLPLDSTQTAKIKYFQDKYSSQIFAQTRQQIKDFFFNFLKEVSEKIQSLEKQALMRLDQNEESLKQFLNPESFQSLKQKLYQTILAGKCDSDKINKEITLQIKSYQETVQQRLMTIQQDLDDLQKQLFLFSEKQSHIQRDKVIQKLQHVEDFLEFERHIELKKFELIKSGVRYSKQAIITRNENEDGGIIIKNPTKGHISAYSNFIIDPKLKYLITVEVFNKKKDGHQVIGLMEDELKEQKIIQELRLAFNNKELYALTKQIKGECFTKSLRNVERFELQIQIYLKDKLFIVSDFPEKKSIFALEESAIKDKQYRLGVELYYGRDAIKIKQLELVELFPQLL